MRNTFPSSEAPREPEEAGQIQGWRQDCGRAFLAKAEGGADSGAPHVARPRQAAPPRAGREKAEKAGDWGEAAVACPHCGTHPTAAPDPEPCSSGPPGARPARPRVLTRHQQGQQHDEHSHGSAAAAALQDDTEQAPKTRATTAAAGGDALRLVATPRARPVVASAGTAAAFYTNRQLRRCRRERRG